MEFVVLILCAGAFLWWAELAAEWWFADKAGADLAEITDPAGEVSLSVIVPARNEESTVRDALASLMEALPAGGEVIFVNDGSTDATGAISREFAQKDPRLRVLDIRELPEGWLGKTHAMQAGYEVAGGEYLLFTDADVIFSQGCLSRAVALCRDEGIDHLVATPRMITRGFWERTFVSFFSILLVSRFRLWRARDPGSRFYAGIGAFNLVRRGAYEKAGTHQAIRSEVVDDLQLGRIIKRSGGRQQVVSGERCLSVRWNEGLRGLITGLEKNAYAGFDYSPLKTVAGCASVLAVTVLPAVLPVFYVLFPDTDLGAAALSAMGVWLSFLALYKLTARGTGSHWSYFLTFPLGSTFIVWAIMRSMVLFYLRGGVKWRGTVYGKSRLS